MPFTHGSKAKVYTNGYNVSAFLRSAQVNATADTAETSTFGNTFKTYIAGLTDATLSVEGLYDGAVDAIDDVLRAALGNVTNAIWTVALQGDAIGDSGVGFVGAENSYQISAGVGDVSSVTAEAQGNQGYEPLRIHHAFVNESAGGNGTAVDGTAQTTNGGYGYLQVSSATTLVVKIQDSADGSTGWADILTFNTVASGRAAQRAQISGTVRRFTRALWTGSGTFSAAFGRKL